MAFVERDEPALVRADAASRVWGADRILPGSLTVPRHAAVNTGTPLTLGSLHLTGGAFIARRTPVTGVGFVSGTTAWTPGTHLWFCIVDRDLNVLAKTVDNGATAWGANSVKELNLSSQLYVSDTIPVYLGIVVADGTSPSFKAVTGAASTDPIGPNRIAGTSTAGLTVPGDLGATAVAPATSNVALQAYLF